MLGHTTIGEELAASRRELAQRLQEARDVVQTVLARPPFAADGGFAPPPSASPVEEAELLLREHLDRFKAMVFNGGDSVRLAVSGHRLNKVSRRLHEATERVVAAWRPIDELAAALALRWPGREGAIYHQAATALFVLRAWDAGGSSRALELAPCVLRSLARDGRVRLALFVCCPADFTRLWGERPERYLLTDMHGSVLSRLVPRLRELFRSFEGAGIAVELLTIVGDTDEDDYLWQGIVPPAHLDRAALDLRREQLVGAVAEYMAEPVGDRAHASPRVLRKGSNRVVRLSAIVPSPAARDTRAAVAAEPLAYFDERDVAAEMAIMRGLWQPALYYYRGLAEPDDAALRRIVAHKLATYAMQGVLLWELDRDLVLVQSERPPRLRDKMLNAGRERLGLPRLLAVEYFEPERGT